MSKYRWPAADLTNAVFAVHRERRLATLVLVAFLGQSSVAAASPCEIGLVSPEDCSTTQDEDCDGVTGAAEAVCDPNSATVTLPVYASDSSDFRRQSASLEVAGFVYGPDANMEWDFLPSATVGDYSLRMNGVQASTGVLGISDGVTTNVADMVSESSVMEFAWYNGPSRITWMTTSAVPLATDTGFSLAEIEYNFQSPSTFYVHQIELGRSVDVFFGSGNDPVFVEFVLPGGRPAILGAEILGGGLSGNVDVFVVQSESGLPNKFHYEYKGDSTDNKAEYVWIPAAGDERKFVAMLSLESGVRSARFVAYSPVVDFSIEEDIFSVCIEEDIPTSDPLVATAQELWARSAGAILDSTDGQYWVGANAELEVDKVVSWGCDLYLSDDIYTGPPSCTPAFSSILDAYVDFAEPAWKGEEWSDDGIPCSQISIGRAATIMAHEWGHFEFDLGDEYDSDYDPITATTTACGASIMGHDEVGEYCTPWTHGIDATSSVSTDNDPSDWSIINALYAGMSIPSQPDWYRSSNFHKFAGISWAVD